MKIVVIGGTGMIGTKLVNILRQKGHEAIPASPETGINTLTGDGLAEVLTDADIVVDVSNSPSFEDEAVLKFFETSSSNLTSFGKQAGINHHVVLSIVKTDQLPKNGYFRAKVAQENIVKNSGLPFTIVRSTQFFDFLGGIAHSAGENGAMRISTGFVQPIASNDVATFLAETAIGQPFNDTIEIAGPEKFQLSELVRNYLRAIGDQRTVIADQQALYFGSELEDNSLIPDSLLRVGTTDYKAWLKQKFEEIQIDD